MITGELRNKIDKIWETFWTGGITNPLDVIEQFTYLLFIKQLDEVETTKENEANFLGVDYESMFPGECQKYRWSKFKNLGSAEEMYELVLNGVFPFIKNLHQDGDSAYARYMGDAIFKIPTAAMLSKIVDGIDKLELGDEDSKGDLYEYLLSKVATAGTNGQFRTPRHIIKMMVELVKPAPDDTIIDPAMGSAGFLIEAQSYLRENHPELFLHQESLEHFNNTMFYGNDMDRTMLRIGAMNMLLHGVDDPNIEYKDSLSEMNTDKEKNSLILANPPFKGSLDYDGTFDISGGILVAAGSSGMAQMPSDSSSQKILNLNLTSQEANTVVNVKSSDGKNILTYAPLKNYSSVIVSTPDIKDNTKYTVSVGGTAKGEAKDGLYSDGNYSGGTEVGSETTSNTITNITQEGASTNSMRGQGGRPGGKGHKMQLNTNGQTNNQINSQITEQ